MPVLNIENHDFIPADENDDDVYIDELNMAIDSYVSDLREADVAFTPHLEPSVELSVPTVAHEKIDEQAYEKHLRQQLGLRH